MQINSLNSTVIIGEALEKALGKAIKACKPSKLFVLTDENTVIHCLPILRKIDEVATVPVLTIGAGEGNKKIGSVEKVWQFLTDNGADREALMINLGGGMIGDLGGFAAATFKRGINFVNIPTTLLAQVDASIGGKLGFNFAGLKNEVGLFHAPQFVILSPEFLASLDKENLLSGYAEMMKHAFIYGEEHWKKLKEFSFTVGELNYSKLESLISKSVLIKNDYVQSDFREKGMRKALNFGHTYGHAIESYLMEDNRPVLHGAAVAHGMVCELYLSHKKHGLPITLVNEVKDFVFNNYGKVTGLPAVFDRLNALMQHDKKNQNNKVNFTLLSNIGNVEINQHLGVETLREAIDFYDRTEIVVS